MEPWQRAGLWHIRWRVQYHKSAICIPGDGEFKLSKRWHFCFRRTAAGAQDEQAAVGVAEFYLEDMSVPDQLLERCRAYFQTLKQLMITGPHPERHGVFRVDLRIEDLQGFVIASVKRSRLGVILCMKQCQKINQDSLCFIYCRRQRGWCRLCLGRIDWRRGTTYQGNRYE